VCGSFSISPSGAGCRTVIRPFSTALHDTIFIGSQFFGHIDAEHLKADDDLKRRDGGGGMGGKVKNVNGTSGGTSLSRRGARVENRCGENMCARLLKKKNHHD